MKAFLEQEKSMKTIELFHRNILAYIYILGDTLKWGAEPRTKNGDIIGK
jgi:hypothetical protein